jgi:hypothetical protein
VPLLEAVYLQGCAGTLTVHNARCVHGSRPNGSVRSRPLLLNTFTSANAAMKLDAGTNALHLRSRRGACNQHSCPPALTPSLCQMLLWPLFLAQATPS